MRITKKKEQRRTGNAGCYRGVYVCTAHLYTLLDIKGILGRAIHQRLLEAICKPSQELCLLSKDNASPLSSQKCHFSIGQSLRYDWNLMTIVLKRASQLSDGKLTVVCVNISILLKRLPLSQGSNMTLWTLVPPWPTDTFMAQTTKNGEINE